MQESSKDVADAIATLLNSMGLKEGDYPEFKNTVSRFGKAMKSFSVKKPSEHPKVTTFPNPYPDSNIIVEIEKSEVRSLCGHHLFPFFGYARVIYVPNKLKVGLSKIPRIVDYFSNQPQDQENLTQEILTCLYEQIKPKAILVELKCTHTCMSVRGAKAHQALTTTTLIKCDKDFDESKLILKL